MIERLRDRVTAQPASLYVVIAIGTALRLFGLGAENYWIDEFRSLTYVANRTPIQVAVEIPFFDPHPPLYYVLLDLWTDLFGRSEPMVRLLSAIFGIAAIPMLYLVGKELYDERVGVVAAGILALSRFHIRFSQTARMYSLFVFATLLSMYWLLRLREDPSRRNTVAYFVSTVILVYAHVFGTLVVAAQHCYVLASRYVREDGTFAVPLRKWIGTHVVVVALAIPWGIGIATQAMTLLNAPGGKGSNLSWIPQPTVIRLVSAVGQYVAPSLQDGFGGFLVLVVVGLLAVGSASRIGLDRERTLLLGCWIGISVLGLFVVSYLLAPLFVARYTSAALPAVALLVSKEIRRMDSVEIRYIAGALLVVGLVVGLPSYYGQPQYTEWNKAATYVADHGDANDAVLIHFGHAAGTFGYYLHQHQPGMAIDGISGKEMRAIENTSTPPPDPKQAMQTHDDVWLVLTDVGYERRDALRTMLNESGYREEATREYYQVTVYHFVANGSED